ncbi:tetratricopeptide repeat-containing protein [Azohydromonas australica]|uniref:tetratricopeptide repeat-containing protein n=1 Tax=Azohydromonas australica TaxID=364039 RepID=UPI000409B6CC|nr:tetratricopeptide repeat-containing protein [Azohydromonas australica]
MRYFVIRGFGRKKDSQGREIDFDRVDRELIRPALALCNFEGGTTQTEDGAGNIRADMFALILEADVVVCDITVHNANVFYELGVRHALRKKHTVLIKGSPSADTTPFDLSTDRYRSYTVDDPKQALQALVRAVQAGQLAGRETDSFPGARDTWERVREGLPQELEANLALANVYERLYRQQRKPALLESSNQAVQRTLGCPDLRAGERAEATALRARNLKTLWRRQFEGLPTLQQRRAAALSVHARDAYAAYLEAFQLDLNSFFPGVAT